MLIYLENEVFVYSMTTPYDNVYTFADKMKFYFPTMPALTNQGFPVFMKNLWKLKVINKFCYMFA